MKTPLLFVALDFTDHLDVIEMTKKLSPIDCDFGYKINLDYALCEGLSFAVNSVRHFGDRDRPVFVDLKMWNGSRTMVDVVKQLVDLEVDLTNIYALADTEIEKAVEATKDSKTKILGLTVLTHYESGYCQEHYQRSMYHAVRHLAEVAMRRGCHGVVVPGGWLEIVADWFGFLKLVPGIRPSWYKDTRHAEEVTPTFAREHGADMVVCGSPITKSEYPVDALLRVLDELNGESK